MSAASHLVEADQELVNDYYTAQAGLHSASLEFTGTPDSSDTWRLHDAKVREMKRGVCRRYDAVRATLVALAPEHRATLDLIYVPFGTGFERRHAYECLRCGGRYIATTAGCRVCGANRDQALRSVGADVDLLAMALTTRWGHGSYVRMAVTQSRAIEAYAKAHPGDGATPAWSTMLRFLAREAGRGQERESFFGRLRNDCDVPHKKALEAYDALRTVRMEREAVEGRERSRLKAAEREAVLEDLLGVSRRKARDRFDRLLRGGHGGD